MLYRKEIFPDNFPSTYDTLQIVSESLLILLTTVVIYYLLVFRFVLYYIVVMYIIKPLFLVIKNLYFFTFFYFIGILPKYFIQICISLFSASVYYI